jgi:elongation factor Ts
MGVSLETIRALREKTSASLKDVREALEQAGGQEEKALELLRKRGAQIATSRQGRATSQGRVEAYVHHDGRLGAIVEVDCETDFVARTDDFSQFCRDVAMQVASMGPTSVEGLLEQPFIKESKHSMNDMLNGLVAKTGEKIVIRRFTRFMVGEAVPA